MAGFFLYAEITSKVKRATRSIKGDCFKTPASRNTKNKAKIFAEFQTSFGGKRKKKVHIFLLMKTCRVMLVARNKFVLTFTAERFGAKISFRILLLFKINKTKGMLYNKTCLIFGGKLSNFGRKL